MITSSISEAKNEVLQVRTQVLSFVDIKA